MPNHSQQPTVKPDANEGEGSRSAARNYDAKTEQFVKSGKVEAAAEAAEKAVNGPEKEELEAAEKVGRQAKLPKGANALQGTPSKR